MAEVKQTTKDKNTDTKPKEFRSQGHLLYSGTGTPYLAIFNTVHEPIIDSISGLPISVYISSFSYTLDHETENECRFTIDTGNPDTVDVSGIQSGDEVVVQYGYVFSDGTFESSKPYILKVKSIEATFDSTGTHVTVILKDSSSDLKNMKPFRTATETYTFKNFMDEGFGVRQPIIIESYEPVNVTIDESKIPK